MNYTIARKKGSGAIIWSEDQKHYVVEQYTVFDKTLKELSIEFNVQPQSIRNLLRKQNIEITNKKIRNFPRKSNFFEIIDTSEKAYWLGVIYSDGSINDNNLIALALKDKDHVEKFRNTIGAVNKITEVVDYRWQHPCYIYRFSIHDKKLHDDLILHGVLPNKSYHNFNFPNIPNEFIYDFIRGYFDGDGSIYFTNNKYKISFVGNKVFLNDLKNILGKQKLSLCQNSVSSITYDLKISGKKDISTILHKMYDNSTENTRLNRKYKLVQKCFNFLGESLLNQ